ncbi:hypothetical protein GCM10007940_19580 [Portibacter lacus]|uniref:Uncharacterized protein n=2 Tax=Portibacter lacus TaxID=1099794 RepID=A0AA37SSH4_9BACT|nr:hypothetical protein GCM10007940_19580 [Portibacter lacus]
MAILMLFSSVGYSIDMHYCQDQLKSIAIFGKSKSCHEMAKKVCPMHKDMTIEQEDKDCCNNKTVVVEGLDNDKIGFQTQSLSDQNLQFIVAYVYVLLFSTIPTTDYLPTIKESPPLPTSGLHIQFQQFLI